MDKPTVHEVMATALSHELKDNENWFIGLATGAATIFLLSRIPIAAMGLAQNTHAPNSLMLVAGWIINPIPSEIPTGMESEYDNSLQYWRCEAHVNSLSYSYSMDEVDVGFGSAAQIDKYGNCNIVCIGDYYKPKVRLIGPINQPAHFTMFGREYIIVDHDKRNFVDKVDFISGPGYIDGPGAREKLGLTGGGPHLILTDKAIFDFDPKTKLVRLKSVHPGTSVDEVIASTGYTHDWVPKEVPETISPTDEELRLLREVVDPKGRLLPRE